MNAQVYMGAQGTEAAPRQVEGQYVRLQQAIADLGKTQDVLAERLGGVLRPIPPTAEKNVGNPQECLVEVAERLRGLHLEVQSQISFLNSVLDRLEL